MNLNPSKPALGHILYTAARCLMHIIVSWPVVIMEGMLNIVSWAAVIIEGLLNIVFWPAVITEVLACHPQG